MGVLATITKGHESREPNGMRKTDVNLPVLRRSVDAREREFRTAEVSDDAYVKAAHCAHVVEWAYGSVIGRVLSQNAVEFGIRKGSRRRGKQGQHWVKIR